MKCLIAGKFVQGNMVSWSYEFYSYILKIYDR